MVLFLRMFFNVDAGNICPLYIGRSLCTGLSTSQFFIFSTIILGQEHPKSFRLGASAHREHHRMPLFHFIFTTSYNIQVDHIKSNSSEPPLIFSAPSKNILVPYHRSLGNVLEQAHIHPCQSSSLTKQSSDFIFVDLFFIQF